MLMTFKSRAGPDVLMFGEHARKLLALLGKDERNTQGIVTTEQLPEAIACLQAAIDAERSQENAKSLAERDAAEDAEREAGRTGMAASVNLAQRAWPLLDLLRRSQAEDVPVTWGT